MSDEFNIFQVVDASETEENQFGGTDDIYGGTDDIYGGIETYRNDRNTPAMKDSVLSGLIPNTISECALYLQKTSGEVCMSDEIVKDISTTLNIQGPIETVVSAAKTQTKCETEKCLLTKMARQLGDKKVKKEIMTRLKVAGPTDSKLLSNVHIDNTLQQWSHKYDDFYPFNFNMLDYASYSWRNGTVSSTPDSLATVAFSDLYNGDYGKKYRCCACVINSDRYRGSGKHWMALFADARGADRWTVEFFNSSGNAPAPEWVNWLVKTKSAMETLTEIPVEILRVTNIRHQQSKSECGVYSLFYILSRLNNVPPEYFMKHPISDQLMFELRSHLFDDPSRKSLKSFDWNEYKSTVRIEWEKD